MSKLSSHDGWGCGVVGFLVVGGFFFFVGWGGVVFGVVVGCCCVFWGSLAAPFLELRNYSLSPLTVFDILSSPVRFEIPRFFLPPLFRPPQSLLSLQRIAFPEPGVFSSSS